MDNNDNSMLKAWCATFVRRWHSNPLLADTIDPNGHHQHRCTILLLLFWPDSSRGAIIDCLTHDQGEIDAGDMPHPAKRKYPDLRNILDTIETESITEQGFDFLVTAEEIDRRKFVDYLDAYIWMLKNKPNMRRLPTWIKHLDDLEQWASRLGVRDQYLSFINASFALFV